MQEKYNVPNIITVHESADWFKEEVFLKDPNYKNIEIRTRYPVPYPWNTYWSKR